ncbi:MAG TPA: hypothetical protein VK610_08645 [Rhodothermales bacterium]|nr:hypothetical protein [Rhodothermales bacterium]
MTDTERLAAYYRSLPDERLLQIAMHEAGGLVPEAVGVLLAETEARGLVVPGGVRTLARSSAEIDALIDAVRVRPCPHCGGRLRPLNAGRVAQAMSLLLFTHYQERIEVACPDCLARKARHSLWFTVVLGWWGFPFGPIRSVQALVHDGRTLRQRRSDAASPTLRSFVEQNQGLAVAFATGQ